MRTPNLFIEDGGATQNIAMRGLGSPDIEASVVLYIDNISFARPRGVTQNLFDNVDRDAVRRGVQQLAQACVMYFDFPARFMLANEKQI